MSDPRNNLKWVGGEGGRRWRKTSYREWRSRLVHDVLYFRKHGASQSVHYTRMKMVRVRHQLLMGEIPLYWPGLFDD